MRPTLVFPPEFDIPATSAERSILLIGRHPHCDVVLPVASVSRRHCVLAEVDDDFVIRDMGSKHGLWVNGLRVEERSLRVGDEIAIGAVIVRVVDPDALPEQSRDAAVIPDPADDEEDSPTELQAEGRKAAVPDRSQDSGYHSTEAMRPDLSEGAVSRSASEANRSAPNGKSRRSGTVEGDDFPSESELELHL